MQQNEPRDRFLAFAQELFHSGGHAGFHSLDPDAESLSFGMELEGVILELAHDRAPEDWASRLVHLRATICTLPLEPARREVYLREALLATQRTMRAHSGVIALEGQELVFRHAYPLDAIESADFMPALGELARSVSGWAENAQQLC